MLVAVVSALVPAVLTVLTVLAVVSMLVSVTLVCAGVFVDVGVVVMVVVVVVSTVVHVCMRSASFGVCEYLFFSSAVLSTILVVPSFMVTVCLPSWRG